MTNKIFLYENPNFFKLLFLSWKNKNFWLKLPYLDIKLKYRRTKLGPVWHVLTILLTISLMSILWSIIFNFNIKEYLPRLYFGMTTWSFVVAMTVGSTTLYNKDFSSLINTINVNLFDITIRHYFLTLLNYLHYLPLAIIFYIFLDVRLNINIIWFFIGIFLVMINFIWISFFFAAISSRFRDIIPLTQAIMTAAPLMTPILWKKEQLGEYQNLVYLNPFTFFVEAIRDPLIGIFPGLKVYLGLLLIFVFGIIITQILIKKKYSNIVFWSN